MNIEHVWAAGFWDGEGCVSLSYRGKYQYPRSVLQIAQVDRRPLERFRNAVGFGNVLGPYPSGHAKGSEYSVWRVEGNTHLLAFKNLLYQYLCEPKREQIDKAIRAREIFESTATCPIHTGTKLVAGGKGYRCLECQSIQGKKNAIARWGERKVIL